MRLVADRFAQDDHVTDGQAVDLATGCRVVLTIGTAGGQTEQARWSTRCDALQRLHHPALAPLVDFGIVGETSRFEAWNCGPAWTGSAAHARGVEQQASA